MNAEDLHAVKCAVSTTIARFGALGTSHQWTSVVKPAVQRHLCNSQVEEIVCYCLGNVNVRRRREKQLKKQPGVNKRVFMFAFIQHKGAPPSQPSLYLPHSLSTTHTLFRPPPININAIIPLC